MDGHNINKTAGGHRWAMAVMLCWILAELLIVPMPAMADIAAKAVLVAVRTFAFVGDAPNGAIDLAIAFDPADAVSRADMKTALDALSGDLQVGGLSVHPVPLPVSELDRLSAFRFVLITSGLQRYGAAIFTRTRGRGTMTVSADLDCVRDGYCVMGVVAEPRVEVVVNRAAAQAAAVTFDPNFIMMITER
jgi:hypothetical protein